MVFRSAKVGKKSLSLSHGKLCIVQSHLPSFRETHPFRPCACNQTIRQKDSVGLRDLNIANPSEQDIVEAMETAKVNGMNLRFKPVDYQKLMELLW